MRYEASGAKKTCRRMSMVLRRLRRASKERYTGSDRTYVRLQGGKTPCMIVASWVERSSGWCKVYEASPPRFGVRLLLAA